MSETEPGTRATPDVPIGGIVLAAGGLIACLVLVGLGSWVLYKIYLGANPVSAPNVSPEPTTAVEPRLQVAPVRDLAALRAEEERTLHGRGWVDQQAGIAHIPIEQAMALLAKRSERQAPSPSATGVGPRH